jgi:signal transduction histidine kinase
VELGAGAQGEGIEFWVKDSGPGIDSEDLPHIFERFYRGHNQSASGSGLGLAIVKSAVEAQGGRVWVESKLGEGAVFRVRFEIKPD